MRVLLIAEACNPEMVSVPLVGWSHARAISRLVDAHIVTQVRNRDALRRAGLVEGKDFTSIDTEAIIGRIYQVGARFGIGANRRWSALTSLTSLAYPYFEHLVWRRFGGRIRAREFDIVHRLVPLSPTAPSLLAANCRRANVPFVLGPLNGGLPWPPGFAKVRRREGEWPSSVRNLYRLVPGYLATRRNASAILIASRATLDQVPRIYRPRCFYIPENAIEPSRFTRRRQRRAALPLRAVSIGRVVPFKAADLFLLAAAPFLRSGKLVLDIVGDGPDMPLLRGIIKKERIETQVKLSGWVTHSQVQERLAEADLLAFPSIRDFGGGVVLEAMAVGVVPIVVNYGGPGELATNNTGFLIPLGSPTDIVNSLTKLLQELVSRPDLIDRKSTAALRRAHVQFTWDYKARQVANVYSWICDPRRPKPNFPIPWPDLADERCLGNRIG